MFTDLFAVKGHDQSEKARQYLRGLAQAKKKNIERMEEVVEDSGYQSLQRFISCSPWDHRAVIDRVAHMADEALGGRRDSCLLIDETYFSKKGDKSVGVQRQWNGRLGKTDNCQVAVFASLCNRDLSTPVDVRLYLPKGWVKDRKRCQKARVPLRKTEYKPKTQLALEIVGHARQSGLRFEWVSADGGYGKDPGFLRNLDDMGETFFVDVHKNCRVYPDDPNPYRPRVSGRGRKTRHLRTDIDPMRVDKLAESFCSRKWCVRKTRDSTKGPVTYELASQRIWFWDKTQQRARQWRLVVRRDAETKKNYKYTLCNASPDNTLTRLGYCQGQRFWIERDFENGKGQSGWADYQIRGWVGWHHHMALVMMALLFLTQQRINHRNVLPLLSCADVVEVLCALLPQRNRDANKAIDQMHKRHAKRRSSIASAYHTRGFEPPGP